MRAWVLPGYKKSVELRDLPPLGDPGPGELLVDVHAAAVNPVDPKIREGKVNVLGTQTMPAVLGCELSGVVQKIGAGVSRFKVGDAVYARLEHRRLGGFAEQALLHESAAARIPARMSHTDAASLPLSCLTAWQALVETAQLKSGQSVLIQAGSGGLGTVAIQLARHLGAVVSTTVSARNEALVRGLGATTVVDYRNVRFEDVLHDLDVVLDSTGGETLERAFKAIKPGGKVVSVNGVPDAAFARAYGLNPLIVLGCRFLARKATAAARARGAHYAFVFVRPDGPQLERITGLVEQGEIRPVVDRVFPLEQAKEALAYIETGRATGKIVLAMRNP